MAQYKVLGCASPGKKTTKDRVHIIETTQFGSVHYRRGDVNAP